jgi:nucleotide-binding universal stress UspA family protein
MRTAITKILVPTDFSPPSEQALDYARGLAHQFGASLHLLHAINRPLLAEGLAAEAFMSDGTAMESDMVEVAQRRLRKQAPEAASADVVFGYAARSIVEYASRLGVDLIVMGSHGRTGIAHVLLGSVAEAVVRTAPCPVLTVRGQAKNAKRVTSFAELEANSMNVPIQTA